MANLVLATASDTLTFPAAAGADYRTAPGKYHERAPVPGSGDWAFQDSEAPAVDGVDVKAHGFRNRSIGPFKVVFVGASEAAAITAYLADRDKLVNKEITVTHPTAGSLPGCRLASMAMDPDVAEETGAGTYIATAFILLDQKRLA